MGLVLLDSARDLLWCQQQAPILGAIRVHETIAALRVAANDGQWHAGRHLTQVDEPVGGHHHATSESCGGRCSL